jgi:hypothetical protein
MYLGTFPLGTDYLAISCLVPINYRCSCKQLCYKHLQRHGVSPNGPSPLQPNFDKAKFVLRDHSGGAPRSSSLFGDVPLGDRLTRYILFGTNKLQVQLQAFMLQALTTSWGVPKWTVPTSPTQMDRPHFTHFNYILFGTNKLQVQLQTIMLQALTTPLLRDHSGGAPCSSSLFGDVPLGDRLTRYILFGTNKLQVQLQTIMLQALTTPWGVPKWTVPTSRAEREIYTISIASP